jgi:ribosome-binding protein aMBF1 (putative translation factor)
MGEITYAKVCRSYTEKEEKLRYQNNNDSQEEWKEQKNRRKTRNERRKDIEEYRVSNEREGQIVENNRQKNPI